MGEVLEQHPIFLDKFRQVSSSIAVQPAVQDEMMCPLDDVDRIDLDKAHLFDDAPDGLWTGPPRRVIEQPVSMQEQRSCLLGTDCLDAIRAGRAHGSRVARGFRSQCARGATGLPEGREAPIRHRGVKKG